MSITNTDIVRQLQGIIDQLQEDARPAKSPSKPAVRNLADPDELRVWLTDRIKQAIIDIDEENIEHGYVTDDADLYQVQFADLLTLAYSVCGGLDLAGVRDVPIAGIIISLLATLRDYEDYKQRLWVVPTDDLGKIAALSADLLAELINMEQEES
ncbi:MAG: hypothetical protein UHD09_08270 [Bifidobacterium sp.]|nr:hypothetical protein [Bifidobacterium sp.]